MKWGRDLSKEATEKCLSHVKGFVGAQICVTMIFDYILANWKKRKIKNQIFKEVFGWFRIFEKIAAENASSFDSYVILKNLPPKTRAVKFIRPGKFIFPLKFYNVRVGVRSDTDLKILDKGTADYLKFICSTSPIKTSL